MSAAPLRRRALLGGAGLLALGFGAGCAIPVIPKRPVAEPASAWGWITHRDGRYQLRLPRVEMGQGASLGLRQLAAEALGLELAELQLLPLDSAAMGPVRATVGSESISDFGPPLVQACVLLREAVGRGLSQAELPRLQGIAPPLRGDGHLVGRSLAQPEDEAIVRGAPLFVADLRRPGLLHGRVLRAPASPLLASRCIALDEAAARAEPGFVALLRDPRLRQAQAEGIAIVARTPGALQRIAERLAPRWQVDGRCDEATAEQALALDGRPRHRLVDEAMADSEPWDLELRLSLPPAAHAAIEPRAALAEPDGRGGLRLWVGSQDPFYVRDHVADLLGLSKSALQVQAMRIGGGFGGRALVLVEGEAALLAQTLQAPVRVQWTRAQEFQQGFHRPPSRHRLRVRLGADGSPQAWWHRFASGPVIFSNAAMPPWLQRLASQAVADRGVARGALPPYRIAARRIGFDSVALPLASGPWRGLGAGPNGLLVETGIDECAHRAGADPLAYRLRLAEPPRLRRLLQALQPHWTAPRAAAPAGWRAARGLACGVYKENSFVAVQADLQIELASGALRIQRLLCLHDCGLVVNPDRVRAQCEGNLLWGLGMVLVEGLALAEQGVAAAQFGDAPIPRLPEMPDQLQIELIDQGEPPGGAGETAIVAAGAALLNAVREASGWRPERLPLQARELQAALQR